jgi:hypothetical protein
VDTDPDTLATALFVKTDDLLKSSPQLAPRRPTAGITPQLSDAELVTLAMMQAILGFTSEARWLRHARAHLRNLFPYLPKQPGYNKRLRKAAELVRQVTRELATDTANYRSTPQFLVRLSQQLPRCHRNARVWWRCGRRGWHAGRLAIKGDQR